jgi:sigma-B regulation protein RsbQ
MTMVSIKTRNNLKCSGQGDRTLVFVHGFGCDQSMWRFVVPAFEANYKIVLFDLVGSGKSDRAAFDLKRYETLEGYAQDILDVAETLDLTHAILIGHSVSAMLGILAAIREPRRFSHLILVAPSPRYINDPPDYYGGFDRADIDEMLDLMDKNYMGWASFLAPMVMQNPDHPELVQELEMSFCSTDPLTARTFAQATFYADNRQDLAKVPVPCLILQCAEDAISPCEVGAYMQTQLPDSTLVALQATGHCPHLSHPEEVITVIRQYLEPLQSLGHPASPHA